jgi:acetylornithine deacetylase/succinyl-diaminopimelate desuccinylase-like protein
MICALILMAFECSVLTIKHISFILSTVDNLKDTESLTDMARVLTTSVADKIDEALDVDAMIAACQEVIRIPSETCNEKAVSQVFASHMRALGFDEVDIDENGNVIGRIRGVGNGPSIMVNGHMDHVPTGEMVDPFSGEIVDGARWGESGPAIYGRGTCDMKCNVMASAYAIGAIKKSGVRLNGDIILVADVEEETDSPAGVKSVIERGIRADYGLSTESTQCGIHVGHRGKVELELTVMGRTSHAAQPHIGINAVFSAIPLLAAI